MFIGIRTCTWCLIGLRDGADGLAEGLSEQGTVLGAIIPSCSTDCCPACPSCSHSQERAGAKRAIQRERATSELTSGQQTQAGHAPADCRARGLSRRCEKNREGLPTVHQASRRCIECRHAPLAGRWRWSGRPAACPRAPPWGPEVCQRPAGPRARRGIAPRGPTSRPAGLCRGESQTITSPNRGASLPALASHSLEPEIAQCLPAQRPRPFSSPHGRTPRACPRGQ